MLIRVSTININGGLGGVIGKQSVGEAIGKACVSNVRPDLNGTYLRVNYLK